MRNINNYRTSHQSQQLSSETNRKPLLLQPNETCKPLKQFSPQRKMCYAKMKYQIAQLNLTATGENLLALVNSIFLPFILVPLTKIR